MSWMIYGANGYTGRLVAELAVAEGHRPVLAGRSPAKIEPLARRLGLPWQAFSLDDTEALNGYVAAVDLVFHAAGPFVETSKPMVAACLQGKTHYVDVTGEVPVFEHTLSRDQEAKEAGVVLLSGAGFDVVPTDCLGAYVAARVEEPVTLEIAFYGATSTSAGTAKSAVGMIERGGLVRRDGRLQPFALGDGARELRFGPKTRTVIPIPWGDLATAYRSTGIPNITTYMAFPPRLIRWLHLVRPLRQTLGLGPVRRLLESIIDRAATGPDEKARQTGRSYVWARAANAAGESAEAWLETMEAYQFTKIAGLKIVESLLDPAGRRKPTGALTPSQAFGPDFVLSLPDTVRYDTLPAQG